MKTAIQLKTVGVVGAGIMGAGISQVFAESGYDVIMYSRSPEGVRRGMRLIELNQDGFIKDGIISKEESKKARRRIQTTTDLTKIGDANFVIESVPEVLELKRSIFVQLDRLCGDDTIIATNTSGLSITEIASATGREELVAGMHWWNPPHIVPLVEIVKGEKTSDKTCDLLMDLCRRLGKKPVLVKKDVPGFIGNRMQWALFREAFYILEQGVATPEDIDTAIKAGFGLRLPVIGPLQTCDYNGLDTGYYVAQYLLREISNSPDPPETLKEHVERGEFGVKTGRGIYDYSEKPSEEWLEKRDSGLRKMLRLFREMEETAG